MGSTKNTTTTGSEKLAAPEGELALDRWPDQSGMEQCCDGYTPIAQKCRRCGCVAGDRASASADGEQR